MNTPLRSLNKTACELPPLSYHFPSGADHHSRLFALAVAEETLYIVELEILKIRLMAEVSCHEDKDICQRD